MRPIETSRAESRREEITTEIAGKERDGASDLVSGGVS